MEGLQRGPEPVPARRALLPETHAGVGFFDVGGQPLADGLPGAGSARGLAYADEGTCGPFAENRTSAALGTPKRIASAWSHR